jgi:hypothetical protein
VKPTGGWSRTFFSKILACSAGVFNQLARIFRAPAKMWNGFPVCYDAIVSKMFAQMVEIELLIGYTGNNRNEKYVSLPGAFGGRCPSA